ncbi:hypothetical protein FKZ59_11520 [Ureibacillus terrenus]|uniref:Uncharacterized protein n=1 Tax=Ureibacillus terrenus TaxID=118246 RepID=A0A540V058_9BACL|nr:hypothetical protein FKZ59_11520 [Ureibacillus terrenus]
MAEFKQLYFGVKNRFFNNALTRLSKLESNLQTAMSKKIITQDEFEEIINLRKSIRNILILTKCMSNNSKCKVS